MEPTETSRDFVQGFNNAYLIAEYEPDVLAQISLANNVQNEYFDGFFAGKVQWEREQGQSQTNELEKIRNRSRDRENDLERDLF